MTALTPDRLFRWGVASFEPRHDRVLIWSRVPPGYGDVEWEVAADPSFVHVIGGGTTDAGPERDGTVVVDADGLSPATTYWYRFATGGTRSPAGRTRTLGSAGTERVRIGYVCCSGYSVAPLGVFRALAEREVDLVVHLGDYIYEDDGGGGPRRHRPPRAALTLDDYRQRLAQLREDPDCQALHRRHPMTLVWDDHDLADNAWRDGAKEHVPDRDGPWADRVAAAARARQEWLPSRLEDPRRPTRTWRSFAVGDLAEMILLDTRFEGRDLQAGEQGAPGRNDPHRSLLGDDQRVWLEQRMADTSRPWTLVHSGVVVNEVALRLPPSPVINALLPNGYAVLDGKVLHDDQWDGYTAERARLARWMGDRAGAGCRTLLLSGDIHSSWAFEGPPDPDGQGDDSRGAEPVGLEVTVPATSSVPMARTHLPGAWRVIDGAVRRMPHVRWADLTRRGYSVVDLTPSRAVAEWWFVDAFHGDPAGTARLGAALAWDRSPWPPRWRAATPTADPSRPGLPDELPPRPHDLARLRWHRRARRTAEIVLAVGAVVAPAAVLAVARRRR